MKHFKLGDAFCHWTYHDQAGNPIFYVARYNNTDGSKDFIPWSWTGKRWIPKGWPVPRPLYNLHKLHANPTKPVLICEGEKSADAAEIITGGRYVVTTWPSGSKSVRNTNWIFIHGRRVLIWPDADEAGKLAADTICDLLHGNCPEVKRLSTTDQPEGWDAADALAAGWTWQIFYDWAKPRATQIDIKLTVNTEPDSGAITGSIYDLWERCGIPITSQGQPISNIDTVVRLLEHIPELKNIVWFDEFHNKYFTNQDGITREWNDIDKIKLTHKIQRDYQIRRMEEANVKRAIYLYGQRTIKNEPRDWLDSLVWDGTPRIEKFFTNYFGTTESTYANAASRNWWLSMVARIYKPGCQVDNMVILKSRKQGRFKSTALSIIGGKWYGTFGESILSKDFYMLLHGRIIIEIAELEQFGRAEVTTIKRVVSTRNDRFRPPYGESILDFPRQCVFVGTTNEDLILSDHTGGRRFWPIEIMCGDIEAIERDRSQLFAEAVALFKQGETWWKMPQDATEAVQESNRQSDEWEAYIAHFLANNGYYEISTLDVAVDCLHIPIEKCDKSIQMRIGRCLLVNGYERKTIRRGDRAIKIWRKVFTNKDGNDEVEW
jgi:predicted P-loop ATPase